MIETPSQGLQTRRKKTYNQKYRLTKKICDEICTLMAKLPQQDSDEKLGLLNDLLKNIQDSGNQGNSLLLFKISDNIFVCLSSADGQQNSAATSTENVQNTPQNNNITAEL